MFPKAFFTLLLALPTFSNAVTIYASHYDGNVYALSLKGKGDDVSLELTQALQTCGKSPSWLTAEPEQGLLWCSDESSPGTLTSLQVGKSGMLKELARINTPGGGTSSIIYSSNKGQKYLAVAHYGDGSISTWEIPFADKQDVQYHQILKFTLDNHGKVPQDQSRPHQVLLDPTGSFLVSPDLGADQVRVFLMDKGTGKLDACSPISYAKGSGPRFGTFTGRKGSAPAQSSLKEKNGHEERIRLHTVEELGNRLCSFDVLYVGNGCPTFKELGCFIPYPGNELPTNMATLSEIQTNGPNLHVSVRKDGKFNGNDSLVTLTLASEGVTMQENLFSSGGKVPRAFAINKDGDYIAVANQDTSNIVIIKREPHTGKLVKEVASLQVGLVPEPGQWMGLSSIVWYE
ncbi:Lactonase, 7-bladed beta propeller [Aspergillus oryzae]|uniref:Lactonase, 7-bladed beta propeller n=1 Tax=Aspergillus oryzae TaxID=5062 RepID=A0A1S9DH81_ASPOZ|nr:Lactonase, 7-bladed beta propeller [Aspergillus oryzae]